MRYFEGTYRESLPPHPNPLPRGKRVQLENRLRGRGDNRKKIDGIISNRVKYSLRFSVNTGDKCSPLCHDAHV